MLGIMSMIGVVIMPYTWHMYLTLITMIILFSFFLADYASVSNIISRFKGTEKRIQKLNMLVICVSIPIILVFTSYSFHTIIDVEMDEKIPLHMAKGSGIYISDAEYGLEDVTDFIQETVPPDEKIFIGSCSNNKMLGNTIIIYFLSDRKSTTIIS